LAIAISGEPYICFGLQSQRTKTKKGVRTATVFSKFDFKGTKVGVCHDGKHWKIYYFPIDYFQVDLQTMGKFLESLEEKGETVTVIIPNLGRVRLTTLEGVKGFAVITKKSISE